MWPRHHADIADRFCYIFFLSVECLGVKATPEQNFVLNEKDKILIYDVRVISPLSYVFKPLRK